MFGEVYILWISANLCSKGSSTVFTFLQQILTWQATLIVYRQKVTGWRLPKAVDVTLALCRVHVQPPLVIL